MGYKKYSGLLVFFGLFLLVWVNGCSDDDELSGQDQVALEGLRSAYASAKLYNDSLAFCADLAIHCTDSVIAHLDVLYHHNDSLFSFHHGNYSHDNMHDDHHHDGHGMHGQGSSCCHGSSDGHHSDDHTLIDALHQTHVPLHP